ncbi:MAG: imelysin family protein [Comamonas sp.]
MPSPLTPFASSRVRRAAAALTASLGLWAAAPSHALEVDDLATIGHALYGQWYVPQTAQALGSAQALHRSLQAYCGQQAGKTDAAVLRTAQQRFQQAADDWQRVAAVNMGPLVERRTDRMVNFQPLRPARLAEAIQQAPKTLADMERIGSPAKGFPALEHLLWAQPAQPGSPSCSYAVMAAASVNDEIQGLQTAFQATAAAKPDLRVTEEFLNQWIGGLEQLRWERMEKPLRSASTTSGKKKPQLIRMDSDSTIASWRAQWSGLRDLAVAPAGSPDTQVSIAGLVAAHYRPLTAGRFAAAVQEVDSAFAALQSTDLESVQKLSTALNGLKRWVEADIASLLQLSIGFSDGDGD